MCLKTGRLCFAKIRDWNESFFSCSTKIGIRQINITAMFFSVVYDDNKNEAGNFLALADCIMTWEDHVPSFCAFLYIYLHVCGFLLTVSRAGAEPMWVWRSKGKLPPRVHPEAQRCHFTAKSLLSVLYSIRNVQILSKCFLFHFLKEIALSSR